MRLDAGQAQRLVALHQPTSADQVLADRVELALNDEYRQALRDAADADEERGRRQGLHRVAARGRDPHGAQPVVAVDSDDLGPQPDLDGRGRCDLVDQVLGHRVGERGTADEQGDVGRVAGEAHARLARRVAPADDDDLAAPAPQGLARPRPVVDAGAEQPLHPGGVEPAPLDPGGGEQGAGGDRRPVAEPADVAVAIIDGAASATINSCGSDSRSLRRSVSAENFPRS